MTKEITIAEAIRAALAEEMQRDENVYLIGEDIAVFGGCFGVTAGLYNAFGAERVLDTPIAEAGLASIAIGSTALGKRPVAELMFADFISLTYDQIVLEAPKLRYVTGGRATCPIVFRAAQGIGAFGGIHHSNNVEAWLINSPGLVIMSPSTPADAKGMLKTAIRNDNPVVFLEHKAMYAAKGPVPEGELLVPIGKADVVLKGSDVTVIAGQLVRTYAEKAIEKAEAEGISVELIDPRTILPYDIETFCISAKKTGRVVVVHEHPLTGGIGGEFSAAITERCFSDLKKPVKRLGGYDISIPLGAEEVFAVPSSDDILNAIRNIVK